MNVIDDKLEPLILYTDLLNGTKLKFLLPTDVCFGEIWDSDVKVIVENLCAELGFRNWSFKHGV